MKAILTAAALAAAFSVSGMTASAQTPAETKTLPAEALFPFLPQYLKLPASQRDRFHPSYYISNGQAVRAVLKRKSGDVPISFGTDGLISPVPTAADLAAKTQIELSAPAKTKVGVSIKIVLSLPVSTTYEAKALKAGLDQARAGSKSAAGAMAMMVPDFKRVCFDGASAGTVSLAGGKTAALKAETKSGPVSAGSPCFSPAQTTEAIQITLDRAPRAIIVLK